MNDFDDDLMAEWLSWDFDDQNSPEDFEMCIEYDPEMLLMYEQ